MARDGSGNYLLPSGNPVVSGTTITSTHFNTTLNDVAAALTGSLPRDGQASMTGPFRLADGSASIPAFGFNSEASTGLFRPATNTLAFSVGGAERGRFNNGNFIVGSTSDNGKKFQVNGDASISGATTIGGDTSITGATSITGVTNITGNTTVTGTLSVSGDFGFNGNASLQALFDAWKADRRGTVVAVAHANTPNGSLECNGQAVSRTTYAALFAVIGTTHGAGDGSTTFNVPDYRGVVLRGLDAGRGLDSGRTLGSYQADDNKSHNHTLTDPGHNHGVNDPTHTHGAYTDVQGYHGHSINDPGHSHTTPLPYITYGGGPGQVGGSGIGTSPQSGMSSSGTGISINGDGSHGHNVGVYGAGTGIWLNASGTGISIAASGGGEARMKNTAVRYVIWY